MPDTAILKALPNARIGNDICGARYIFDTHGEEIGWIAEGFHLREEYTHGYAVYCRLLENEIYPKVY